MQKFVRQTLFPIDIIRVKHPNPEIFNFDKGIKDFFDNEDTLIKNGVGKLVGNFESTLTVSINADCFDFLSPLKNWVSGMSEQLWKDLGFAESLLIMERSWMSRVTKSSTDVPTHLWPHVHGSTDMVCLYYYKYPKGSAKIRFHNPFEVQFGLTPFTNTMVEIQPEEGELLVWPGWLWHSLEEHTIDDERIVIGYHFNQQSYSVNSKWKKVVTGD